MDSATNVEIAELCRKLEILSESRYMTDEEKLNLARELIEILESESD